MMNTFVRPTEGRIRLYLDSAVHRDWDEWLSTGLFYGVTTNPTLLAAANVPCRYDALANLVHATLEHGIHEVHLQTWGTTADEMFEHGVALAAINHRVVVKVPITRAGVAAVRRLQTREIRTTFTALFSAHQALTAGVVGVDYAAPYLGRISDGGRDGVAEIIEMQTILDRLDCSTRLLVASIRSADELATLAQAGLDTYTFGARVASELFADTQTLAAVAAFDAAASAAPQPVA
jgi:transaldolase